MLWHARCILFMQDGTAKEFIMKAAFACLGERIAPVFDVAGEIRLVETGQMLEVLG